MKVVFIGNEARERMYRPDYPITREVTIGHLDESAGEEEIIAEAQDAEFLVAGAMSIVSEHVINHLPRLKLIHVEGVGYNGFAIEAAAKRGIPVANCKGVNAGAVAEQAVLLMLGCLRSVVTGDKDVRAGRQIETKYRMMLEGIRELSECRVGLVGFGDIAKATAKRLIGFDSNVVYYSRNKAPAEVEEEYHVSYAGLEELVSECDIVSIHVPVTPQTINMFDAGLIGKMNKNAYLINTARGEIVDHQALAEALIKGTIKGAGLDTLYPEPTYPDNPVVDLPEEIKYKVVLAPHIGGITTGTFYRSHQMIWKNIERVINGSKPQFVVNGIK